MFQASGQRWTPRPRFDLEPSYLTKWAELPIWFYLVYLVTLKLRIELVLGVTRLVSVKVRKHSSGKYIIATSRCSGNWYLVLTLPIYTDIRKIINATINKVYLQYVYLFTLVYNNKDKKHRPNINIIAQSDSYYKRRRLTCASYVSTSMGFDWSYTSVLACRIQLAVKMCWEIFLSGKCILTLNY